MFCLTKGKGSLPRQELLDSNRSTVSEHHREKTATTPPPQLQWHQKKLSGNSTFSLKSGLPCVGGEESVPFKSLVSETSYGKPDLLPLPGSSDVCTGVMSGRPVGESGLLFTCHNEAATHGVSGANIDSALRQPSPFQSE